MALRFGVLGTGYWALETHASVLVASDDAELVAIWGRDPAKTEAAAGRFGIAGFTDLDRLLAEVDAVAVAVPPDVQAELAARAAAAGRHLLLDKPLALSLDGADRVAEAVAAGGVASLIFFTLRFLPELAAWVEAAGAAGDWQGGDGAWLGSVFTEPDSPFAGSPWRRAKGALWDLGPHVLSLALPVLGPVERVTAGTGHGDTVHLVLGHAGGASSTLTMSQTVPVPAAHIGLQVWGPEGRSATPPFELAHLDAMGEAVRQLTATVAAGATTHPCDVRLGRDIVAVLEAAERFLSEGDGGGRYMAVPRNEAPGVTRR
jgi:predicted dehydrogenase